MFGQQTIQGDEPFQLGYARFDGRIAQDDFGTALHLAVHDSASRRTQRCLHRAKLVQHRVARLAGFDPLRANHRAQMARRCFQAADNGAVFFRRRQPIVHVFKAHTLAGDNACAIFVASLISAGCCGLSTRDNQVCPSCPCATRVTGAPLGPYTKSTTNWQVHCAVPWWGQVHSA